ncbi:AraC family transcriptional regulator [Paenibacillus pasadenensis]|uniref:AraC family transcriptional regulator n=1 Tax=Paenibacillus pasadenensis TaxID=217090 RepID=UPI00203AEF5F|nr:AraC family transcriptional regulator [Paenibacillus pasadenensis]MCM3747191.1 AraC family transcriptional regulator [Paenibacillus pasadenensis]
MVQRVIGSLQGVHFFEANLPIYVNRAVESYELHEHTHDFAEISYVAEGSGVHYGDGSSLPVSQGDVILIPIGVSHVFRPTSPDAAGPLVVQNCLIDPFRLSSFIHYVPGGTPLLALLAATGIRRFRDKDGECGKLFQRLYYEYAARRPGWEASLHAALLQLLVHLQRLNTEAADSSVPVHAMLEEALRHLHRCYDQPIPTSELARIAGLGERQLQRLFAKHTGMPPLAYQQRLRIREACRLLRDTDGKIAAIGSAVGYQDYAHFTALFRRIMGCAPGHYRKQARLEPV